MARVACKAKKQGLVKERGKRTIEWYDKNKRPIYYCYGYTCASTEEVLEVCKNCKDHESFAQEDMDKHYKNKIGSNHD